MKARIPRRVSQEMEITPKIDVVAANVEIAQTRVTAITVQPFRMGDTPFVNMVRRARKKALLEPGDTKQQWKGEAAACFVSIGIASSRTLPTSSVGYWSPLLSLCNASASEAKSSFGGDFLRKKTSILVMGLICWKIQTRSRQDP